MKYHQLTELLYKRFPNLREKDPDIGFTDDMLIRQWLSEKANELACSDPASYYSLKNLRRILGLSSKEPKSEPCPTPGCINGRIIKNYHGIGGLCGACTKELFKKEEKVEWCKHWYPTPEKAGWYFNCGEFTLNYDCEVKYAQFCPICGIPRPKKKTLLEKFKEEYESQITNDDALNFTAFVEIANEHFKQTKVG